MTLLKETQKTGIEKGHYDLIKGDFNAEEALDIINHLFMQKINFHEIRSFSQDIRLGIEDEASLKRIKELNQAKQEFKKLYMEAKMTGKSMRVNSGITIELI